MKSRFFLIILFTTCFLFFSCETYKDYSQNNRIATLQDTLQVDSFLGHSSSEASSGFTYFSLEGDNFIKENGVIPKDKIEEILHLTFNFFTRPDEGYHEATNMLYAYFGSSSDKELTMTEKNELQMLVYIATDFFIHKSDIDKSERSAFLLRKIMKDTRPIEWNVLSNLLLNAEESLDEKEFSDIKGYLIAGANTTIKEGIVSSIDHNERLKREAINALELLQ